jgi:hypothetical protein
MSESVFERLHDGSRLLLHGPAAQALRTSRLCGDDTLRRISCSNKESQLMFPRMPSGKQRHVKVVTIKYREASEQVATDATGVAQHTAYYTSVSAGTSIEPSTCFTSASDTPSRREKVRGHTLHVLRSSSLCFWIVSHIASHHSASVCGVSRFLRRAASPTEAAGRGERGLLFLCRDRGGWIGNEMDGIDGIKKLIIIKCQRCGRGAGRRQRLIAISFLSILEFLICRQGSGWIHLINPRSDSSRSPRDRPRKVVGTTAGYDQVQASQLPKTTHFHVKLDLFQRGTLQSSRSDKVPASE